MLSEEAGEGKEGEKSGPSGEWWPFCCGEEGWQI